MAKKRSKSVIAEKSPDAPFIPASVAAATAPESPDPTVASPPSTAADTAALPDVLSRVLGAVNAPAAQLAPPAERTSDSGFFATYPKPGELHKPMTTGQKL